MINGIKLEECDAILKTKEQKDEIKGDAAQDKKAGKRGFIGGGIGYNFWDLIGKLNWKGRQDGKNHTKPSQVWTLEQYTRIVEECKDRSADLLDVLDDNDIWANHIGYNNTDKKKMFVYHLIGLGKVVYEGILADPVFACGFMGDEQDFLGFLARF